MTVAGAPFRLEVQRVVAAPADRVFAALTTPALMRDWVCPGDATPGQISCDPSVGGRYEIEMRLADGTVLVVGGRYLQVEPNRKLVYTWKWAHESEESQVTVTLRAVNGGTEVQLVHDKLPSASSRDGHTQGWTSCLDKLVASVR
jgi:uncharacterized protein YndB with AHSA1/START domain